MRLMRSVLVVVIASSVLALAPGAEAAPTPVASCNFTAVTNVRLATDLTCPNTDGIVVGANGITIDLDGYTLTGNRTANNHGIDNTGGFDKVTVKGGTLTKFNNGVHGSAADGMHVTNVVVSGNDSDGIFIVGASARVSSSQVSGNAFTGIRIQGASGRVSSSHTSRNAHSGIYINGDSGRVSSSQSSGNGGYGIRFFGASGRVSSSQASGNANDGIFIQGASARVSSSRASGNDSHGIWIAGDAPKIGKLPGGRSRDKNRAEANGLPNGASDGSGLGILATNFTTAPAGRNVARGNDDPAQCNPGNLC